MLLLVSSLNMLNAQPAESRGDDVSEGQAKAAMPARQSPSCR